MKSGPVLGLLGVKLLVLFGAAVYGASRKFKLAQIDPLTSLDPSVSIPAWKRRFIHWETTPNG